MNLYIKLVILGIIPILFFTNHLKFQNILLISFEKLNVNDILKNVKGYCYE